MAHDRAGLPFSRWWLVGAGAGAMGMAGTYQFVWSSLRDPLGAQIAGSEALLGLLFTTFVVFQTVSQFPAGWVRDRRGPRLPMLIGGGILTVGFACLAVARSPLVAGLGVVFGGIGAGTVYTVGINTPVKWFDDRRGLATGIVTMSFGGTSFVLIPFVRGGFLTAFQVTVLGLGAVVGIVCLLAAVILRDPPSLSAGDSAGHTEGDSADTPADEAPDEASPSGPRTGTWREVVRTWQFWLLYAVFIIVNAVGLMVIGKIVSYALVLDVSPATATATASAVALADAIGVLLGGAVSDRLGRVRTIALTLVACGVALALATAAGEAGLDVAFVGLIAAVAFFRSPAFAIAPALVAEYYGRAHSSANYALLYTAKLWGGVGGGVLAGAAVVAVGWTPTFLVGAVLVTLAGLATLGLKPVAAADLLEG